MEQPQGQLGLGQRLANRLYPVTLVIGFLISLGFPATYYVLESDALKRTATIYAQALAEKLEGFVLESPVLWKYQSHKYNQILGNDLILQSATTIRVLDSAGQSISGYEYTSDKTIFWLNRYAVGFAPIIFNNRQVGTVQIEMSQDTILEITSVLLLVFTVVGTGLAVLVYRFPVKVVQEMEGQIQNLIETVQRSSSESDRLAHAAQASSQRFHDLVQGLDAIVWEADPKTFQFTFISQRAEQILGYPIERWLTEPGFWVNFIHPEDHEQALAFYEEMLQGGSDHDFEYRAVAADGHVVWLHNIVYVVRDQEGQAYQIRGLMVDVTERKQAEERLQAAFTSQRDFINDASHELRTPITIIRCYLELLGVNSQEQRQTLAIVMDELERMSRFVNDLLLLAKAERPDFLDLEIVEISSLTEELYVKASALAARNWCLDALGSGRIIADRQRLTQAVINLAQNATQHTKDGDVIALGSTFTDGNTCFWVRDTGSGIDPADKERIFQRFARSSSGRRSEGAGLGLAIVQAIAAAHSGRVELCSQPGSGSTFTIVIPLEPSI